MSPATFAGGSGRRTLNVVCGLLLALCTAGANSGCRQQTDIQESQDHTNQDGTPACRSTIEFRLLRSPVLKAAAYQNGRQANANAIIEIVGGGV